jgi:hypothetical protein
MRIGKILLLLLAFFTFFVHPVLADMLVEDLTQLSSKRVSRYVSEFEYIVNITNDGLNAENISLSVTSSLAPTTIVNGNITFANLSAGESGASNNRLIFRHDRRIPYDPAALNYAFSFNEITGTDNDGDGVTVEAGDCDDNNADIHPGATEIPDNGIDEDCSGADAVTVSDVDGDGFSVKGGDCDDTNANINPGATEIANNGIDEDCSGEDLITDSDQDGYTVEAGDCDDNNASINPGATDIPNNGIDEDCSGADLITDSDLDGFTLDDGDCDDNNAAINPDAQEIANNGVDEDCNGSDLVTPSGDVDKDEDGVTPNDGDCDDNNPAIYPGATDIANNGIDEDCSGADTLLVSAFSVKITSPQSLATVGATPIQVDGTVDDDAVILTVNGVEVTHSGGQFSIFVALEEGLNTILARGSKNSEQVTDSISISLDQTPPFVTIESHKDGQEVFSDKITITGLINDIVRGTIEQAQANVSVNGKPASISNRSYAVIDVSLSEGENTITATGADQVGNVGGTSIKVNYTVPQGRRLVLLDGQNQSATINTVLPTPLAVQVLDDNLDPVPNEAVVFRVTQGSGLVGAGSSEEGRAVVVDTNAQGNAETTFLLGSRVGVANHKIRAQVVGYDDELIFNASGTGKLGNKISINSGNNQRGAVGQVLAEPLVVAITDDGANVVTGARVEFTVTKGEGLLQNASKIYETTTDSDGRATTELTLGYLTGISAQRITAKLLDAAPGALLTAGFSATGFVAADPGDTRISGVVLDNQDQPIPGVTIRIKGSNREDQTDTQGQFQITQAPIGPVHLIADGSTAAAELGEFPSLSFNLVTIPGVDNPLPSPIYMVKLDTQNAVNVGPVDVELTLDKYPGFKLEVAKGSVTFPDGSKEGLLSVTQVNANKVPMVPPNGMQPQFIVTIQPTNTHFDPPARLTLPNMDAFPPGAQVEMYSYDHDLEEFVSIGLGTVSDDATLVTSNPGVGVIKAGWHCGSQPGGAGCAHNCPVCQDCDGDCNCITADNDPRIDVCKKCKNGSPIDKKIDSVKVKLAGKNDDVVVAKGKAVPYDADVSGDCGAYTYKWDFGDANNANGKSGNHTYAALGTFTAKCDVECTECSTANGSDSKKVYVTEVKYEELGDKYGFDNKTKPTEPWKSVKNADTDTVKALINPAAAAPKVKFKSSATGKATVAPAMATASPQTLTFTGVAKGETSIDAKGDTADSLGKMGVASYPEKTFTVSVRVVNEKKVDAADVGYTSTDLTDAKIKAHLALAYKQAVAKWTLVRTAACSVDFDLNDDGKIDVESWTSTEMDKLIAGCKTANSYDIFLVDNPSDNSFGFMSFGQKYGFVHADQTTSPEKSFAHELGHGAFSLPHPKSDPAWPFTDGTSEKDNVNLMSQGDSLTKFRLRKKQWDVINP